MNIVSFNEVRADVIKLLGRRALIPVVGSGISCGSPAAAGFVPSGTQMKIHMRDELLAHPDLTDDEKKEIPSYSFSEVARFYFTPSIIAEEISLSYLRDNFSNVTINDERRDFFKIDWPYIYSLNIDDAIENSSDYSTVIVPYRQCREEIFSEHKCVIKLHGHIGELISYKDARKVFTTKEYALSIIENAWLLAKLKNDFHTLNIIFIGCSLDGELDLVTLDSYRDNLLKNKSANRIFYFTIDNIGLVAKTRLESYGITDIVKFDSWGEIYTSLLDAFKEAKCLPTTSLGEYKNVQLSQVRRDYERDLEYLVQGKSLLRKGELRLPSFYIRREMAGHHTGLPKKHLTFITGPRLSGKSYLLVNLLEQYPGYDRYIFMNGIRLNDEAFNSILSEKETLFFLMRTPLRQFSLKNL